MARNFVIDDRIEMIYHKNMKKNYILQSWISPGMAGPSPPSTQDLEVLDEVEEIRDIDTTLR